MADERTIYRGHPSFATVFGSIVLALLVAAAIVVGLVMGWQRISDPTWRYGAVGLLLIPGLFLLIKWISLKFLTYEITTERIKVTKGIFSRRTDELELYRVKDTSLIEPFLLRMFGVGNILVITNDAGTPQLEMTGIPAAKEIREQLRQSIEECRVAKGARVMEME